MYGSNEPKGTYSRSCEGGGELMYKRSVEKHQDLGKTNLRVIAQIIQGQVTRVKVKLCET